MDIESGINRDIDGGQVTFAPPCGTSISGPPDPDTFRAIRQHRRECPKCVTNTASRNLGA